MDQAGLPNKACALQEQISTIADGLTAVSKEIQEISRGIHPAILSNGGLGPALKALACRSTIAAELNVNVDRLLPDSTEVAAYYMAVEALHQCSQTCTGHAGQHARRDPQCEDPHLAIRDGGIGAADTAKGSGLIRLVGPLEGVRRHDEDRQ